jgi:hypothetical protein
VLLCVLGSLAKLYGVHLFYTREPYLVGEEVFGFQKRKANVLLGFKGDLYPPDKMNFSRLQVATKFA